MVVLIVLLLVSTLLLGCAGDRGGTSERDGGTRGRVKLTGAGASLPFPLYNRWFQEYSQAQKGVRIDYQQKGSGAGIKDFTYGTVDFGASDAAMSDEEIARVQQGVQLLPLTAGKIVFAYNLEGVSKLKLPRDAYVGILLGEIKKWNDPVIASANPGSALPDQEITVVVRADSSGTTYVLTKHLSEVSSEWADGPGTGKKIVWPDSDKFIKSPKNDGVTATITQTPGAIGYIEYSYAKFTGLPMASLQNKAGNFVMPSLESGRAALASVEMPDNLRVWLPDPETDLAYPIVTYTWLLCYKQYDDPAVAETIKDLARYCLTEGQKISGEMGYVPLPENVVRQVTAALDNIH